MSRHDEEDQDEFGPMIRADAIASRYIDVLDYVGRLAVGMDRGDWL